METLFESDHMAMEKINGIQVVNLSGMPFGKAAALFDQRLKAEKIILLPDLCPGRGALPTGCAVLVDPAREPDWRRYAVSDVGCGICLHWSSLDRVEFEKRRPSWDALASDLSGRAGALGELGGGNHFLDAVVDAGQRVGFVVHSGSRDEGHDLGGLLAAPALFDRRFAEAAQWAADNRRAIAAAATRRFGKLEFALDLPHNTFEMVGGKVLIRKGAMKLPFGGTGLIPSSMDGDMALVEGKPAMAELLDSMLHGTGRILPRGRAKMAAADYDFAGLRRKVYIPEAIKDASLRTEHPECYRPLDGHLQLLERYFEIKGRLKPIAYIGQV